MEDKKCWWYFTFCTDNKYAGRYVKFYGTFSDAREKMFESFGTVWGFQYSEEEWKENIDNSIKNRYPIEEELSIEEIYTERDKWNYETNKAFSFLDSKDDSLFKNILWQGKTLCDIRNEIEDAWNDEYIAENGEDLFNWIGDDDLQDYIQKRFNRRFYEETTYRLI